MIELGKRLRYIHELAYRWEAAGIVTDDFIAQVCATQQRMGLVAEVRLYIKQIIRYLDMAEQEGTLAGVDLVDQAVATQREIAAEQDTAHRPTWDAVMEHTTLAELQHADGSSAAAGARTPA